MREKMISDLVKKFDAQYTQKINLVASENLSSENMRYALQSDLNHRYAIPPKGERDAAIWEYPNQNIIREIISETENIACELFHASCVDISPLSGNQVALIMLTCLLPQGDSFLSVGGNDGGHFTTSILAKKHGYHRFDIPYKNGNIDVEETAALVKKSNAKLIFLDASMILHPYPLRELRQAVGNDIVISYDASHTLGIIAGGAFQSPLEEGADFLHGSTHKSLWGPQKAIILSKHDRSSQLARKVFDRIIPEFVSNAHPHHIAALGIALEEARDFGAAYASAVISNARIFAIELTRRGFKIANANSGFTDNHQLLVKIGSEKDAVIAFQLLEKANINVNQIKMPYTNGAEYGLRLGFSEITRRNISGNTTIEIANLLADVILQKDSVTNVRDKIKTISSYRTGIAYTHEPLDAQSIIKKSKLRA